MKGLEESLKYTIFEVNENKKNDILKYNGEILSRNLRT